MNSLWQNVRSPRLVVLFSLAILFFSSISLSAQTGEPAAAAGEEAAIDGAALFKANCASCHKASSERGTGPGLKDVLSRIPGGNWKYDWVHDNNALRARGDAYANKIFKDFNGSPMNTFPNLTNAQIDAILNYANPGPDEVVAEAGTDGGGAVAAEEDNNNFLFILLVLLVLLIVIIAVLRYAKINLRNAVNDKEGLPEEPGLPFFDAARVWMNNNKRKVALIGIFLFSVLVVKGWYALKGVGVYAQEVKPGIYEGYHPSQPINFSHKIHAGDNEIQCQYCHSGVEKSKTATIPSANVCMNCHREIKQNRAKTEESKNEIAKIYAAVGWDVEKQMYTGVEKPIQWNKVHVLPDHVFFSHQQHVVVGQVACEECHGDVKAMTTVEQQRPLTMGWCVNCHRETPVKMDNNGYYSELHEKMKEKYKGQPITVAMAGGIECARCHY